MSLEEKVYSVLIVSLSNKVEQGLFDVFSEPDFSPINLSTSISVAKRALGEREFDFIIVNSPLADDTGIRFSIDMVNSHQSIILFLAESDQYNEACDQLVPRGVFVMQKPLNKTTFDTVSSWLISARERIRHTEQKTITIEEKMNEIRLVNRAKWILIRELKMTEPDAHRYIEKQAMDRCVQRRVVAEDIIKTYG